MDDKKYIIRKVKELANEWYNNLDDEVFLEIEVYLDTVVFPEMSGVEIAEIVEDEESIYYLAQEVLLELIDFENLIEQTINETEEVYYSGIIYSIDDIAEDFEEDKETILLNGLIDLRDSGLMVLYSPRDTDIIATGTKEQFKEFVKTNEYMSEYDWHAYGGGGAMVDELIAMESLWVEDEIETIMKHQTNLDKVIEELTLDSPEEKTSKLNENEREPGREYFEDLIDEMIEVDWGWELRDKLLDLEMILERSNWRKELGFGDLDTDVLGESKNFVGDNIKSEVHDKMVREFEGSTLNKSHIEGIVKEILEDIVDERINIKINYQRPSNRAILLAIIHATGIKNKFQFRFTLEGLGQDRVKVEKVETIIVDAKDSINEQIINENEREPGREYFDDLIDEMIEVNWGPSVDGYWRNKIKNDSIRDLRKEKLNLDIDGNGKAYVDTTRNEVNDYLEVIADVVLKVKDEYNSIPKVNKKKKSWRAADERKAGLRENMNETFYLIISTLWNEWFGVTNNSLDYYALDGLAYADYAKEEAINHFIRLNKVPTEDEVIDFYINHEADLNQVITRNREIFDNLLDEADINLMEENELEVISFNREELVEYLKSYDLDAFTEDVVEEVANHLDENEDETHIGPDMDKLLGFEEGWIVGISAAKGEDIDIDNYNNHSLEEELTKLGLDFIGPNISMWDGIAEEGFLVNVHSDLNLERLYDLGNKYNQDWVAVWEAPLELGKTIIQVDFAENHTMLDGKAYSIVSDDISGYEATNLNEQTLDDSKNPNAWMTKEYQDELDREYEDDEHENSWMSDEYENYLEDDYEELTYFEVMWYEGPTEEEAVLRDAHYETFLTREEALEFYRNKRMEPNTHLFWVTERNDEDDILDELILEQTLNIEEARKDSLTEAANESQYFEQAKQLRGAELTQGRYAGYRIRRVAKSATGKLWYSISDGLNDRTISHDEMLKGMNARNIDLFDSITEATLTEGTTNFTFSAYDLPTYVYDLDMYPEEYYDEADKYFFEEERMKEIVDMLEMANQKLKEQQRLLVSELNNEEAAYMVEEVVFWHGADSDDDDYNRDTLEYEDLLKLVVWPGYYQGFSIGIDVLYPDLIRIQTEGIPAAKNFANSLISTAEDLLAEIAEENFMRKARNGGYTGPIYENNNNQEHEYTLLSRLVSDCKYFLGHGNCHEEHSLWGLNIADHIKAMHEIYDSLIEKPEWLTKEDINDYETKLYNCKPKYDNSDRVIEENEVAKMNTRKFLTIEQFLGSGLDYDIYENTRDRIGVYYDGETVLTSEGEKYFKDILDLKIRLNNGSKIAVVQTDQVEESKVLQVIDLLEELFYGAAGYIDNDEYERLFDYPDKHVDVIWEGADEYIDEDEY